MNIVDDPNFLDNFARAQAEPRQRARHKHADLIAVPGVEEGDDQVTRLAKERKVFLQRWSIERIRNLEVLAELKEILISEGREKWGYLLDCWPSYDSASN